MTTTSQEGSGRFDRRTVLRALGVAGVPIASGCLSGDEGEAGDERNDDGTTGTSNEPSDGGDDDSDESEGSVGTAEITFLGERYAFDDASCDGSATYPPENERIAHLDRDAEFEFWVERHDPTESNVVEVQLSFPTGAHDETIGEIEAYNGRTTADEIEFELGRRTSGTLHLEPSDHMNDDVEHDPDGGEIAWKIAC